MFLVGSGSSKDKEDLSRWPGGIVPHVSLLASVYLASDDKAVYVSNDVASDNVHLESYLSRLRHRGFEVEAEFVPLKEFEKLVQGASPSISESEVQQQVVSLLQTAVMAGASDIHIDILAHEAVVKFRVNGLLKEYKQGKKRDQGFRVDLAKSWVQVIYNTMTADAQTSYVVGQIQDAQLAQEFLPEHVFGIRLNRGPTSVGEYMSLRLHRESLALKGSFRDRLYQLGYSPYHATVLSRSREQPNGLIIFAGITGSGKTTTLKQVEEACAVDFPFVHFLSVEDPVELHIDGVRQIPVIRNNDEKDDAAKFNAVLRSLLRQDPDRIMVGEIRDHQTADLCVKAAMSGHQVMTTLHAGTPFGIIDRFAQLLRQSGDPDPLQTLCQEDILVALVHQCLVPVLCDNCKMSLASVYEKLPDDRRLRLEKSFPNEKDRESIFLRTPDGCETCDGLGIVGRTVVAEVVPMDRDLLDTIRRRGTGDGREAWFGRNESEKRFSRTLQGHARAKVLKGLIDPIEATTIVGPLVHDLIMEDRILDDDELSMWGPLE